MARDVSPSWITLSKDNRFIYAVNEIASYGPNKSGSVTAYAVDKATGALKKLNVTDSGGSIPCYIVPDPSGKFLLIANYTGGSYSVIRIKPDGSVDAAKLEQFRKDYPDEDELFSIIADYIEQVAEEASYGTLSS